MKHLLYFLSIFVLFNSCKKEKTLTAQQIVDKAITVSGGEAYENLELEFNFRGRHYLSKLENGNFEYTRVTNDSSKTIIDTYGNVTSFKRLRNNLPVIIADTLSSKIENAINSVNYFVMLPYGLNDQAVNKKYLSKHTIKGIQYHKIQVTFTKEGGGEDFDDVYIYWINTDNFKLEYLAYSFTVNGGGMRFREAYNERLIQGIRFVDYNNYKPEIASTTLEDLDVLFENNQLKLLSKIETENITVN